MDFRENLLKERTRSTPDKNESDECDSAIILLRVTTLECGRVRPKHVEEKDRR
jgi:hypothetical protein